MRAMEIGESFVGEGADAAHINTVLGPRSGPVGTAWATALATPSAGAVHRGELPAAALTLFARRRCRSDQGARPAGRQRWPTA
jgi:5,6,7,8-tetrahydromethanopterin hydro-lyase